ncbi:MAG: class I SAM-dependent methyltransferase [Bacteroidales bacterium]|jgi:SAM-dependent methyltransferase
MFHHNSCPLCKSSEISPLLSCNDHLVSGETFELCRCGQCGFTFTNDPPNENEAGRYYESPDYISHTDSRRTLFEKGYQAARKIMLRRKRDLVFKTCNAKKGAILDIGSGTGHFLSVMKQAGWSVTGIEINDVAREYSSSRFGLNVFAPEVMRTIPAQEYDCITLWHVAEHLYDLKGYFSEIGRLLKPGGSVIVALPNCNSFDADHYGKFWAAWDVPRHLWHFSPVTFSKLADLICFETTTISTLPFDVFYISILSERNKRSSAGTMKGIIKGMYFSFLSIFNKMKMSSVVYVLNRKPVNSGRATCISLSYRQNEGQLSAHGSHRLSAGSPVM